jgi:hypothetical protein
VQRTHIDDRTNLVPKVPARLVPPSTCYGPIVQELREAVCCNSVYSGMQNTDECLTSCLKPLTGVYTPLKTPWSSQGSRFTYWIPHGSVDSRQNLQYYKWLIYMISSSADFSRENCANTSQVPLSIQTGQDARSTRRQMWWFVGCRCGLRRLTNKFAL